MYVINEKTKIVNIWSDSEINHQRLASGKYGVIEYAGEVETGYDGLLYAKGFAPVKPEQTYIEKRVAEYPPITDQLDMIWHSIDGGKFGEQAKETDFYKELKNVKDRYPKS